jgi:hypothetical protein
MAQHLKGVVPRLDRSHGGISPQVAAVVARCLQREPTDRYADMHELVRDLDDLGSVDIAILDHSTGPASAVSFWKSSAFKAAAAAALLLSAIIVLAIILQALHK